MNSSTLAWASAVDAIAVSRQAADAKKQSFLMGQEG
jgi:hypothetical protein